MPLRCEHIVAVDQEHTVAGRDAEQRDESDDGRNAQDSVGEEYGEHASDERQRQIQQHDERLRDVLELAVQKHKDDEYTEYAHESYGLGCPFLALELSTVFNMVTFREFDVLGYLLSDGSDGLGEFSTGGVAGNDQLTADVLAVDSVRSG